MLIHKIGYTEEAIARRFEMGRSQGTFENYQPSIRVHESNEYATSLRIRFERINRVVHVQERHNIFLLFDLMYDENVIDLNERISINPTPDWIAFAEKTLGYSYPHYKETKAPVEVRTGFLVTYADKSQKAMQVIHPARLDPENGILYDIREEQIRNLYWKHLNIPYVQISAETLSAERAANIREILKPPAVDPDEWARPVMDAFIDLFDHTDLSIKEIAAKCEEHFQLKKHRGLCLFWHLARTKQILPDIDHGPIRLNERRRTQTGTVRIEIDHACSSIKKPIISGQTYAHSSGVPATPPSISRVLLAEHTKIWLIDINPNSIHRPYSVPRSEFERNISANELSLLSEDPYDSFDGEITPEAKNVYDQLLYILANYPVKSQWIYDSENKRRDSIDSYEEDLNKLAEITGLSKLSLKRAFIRYYQSGFKENALIPRLSERGRSPESYLEASALHGAKSDDNCLSGKLLTIEDMQHFLDAILHFYCTRSKPTIEEAYNHLLIQYYSLPGANKEKHSAGDFTSRLLPAGQTPSYNQFYYFFRSWREDNLPYLTRTREGSKAYQLQFASALKHHNYGLPSPLSRVMVDSTRCDYTLVSEFDRSRKIGRGTLHYVIDVMSAELLGYAFTLNGEDWSGAAMALYCAFTNKPEYFRKLGFEFDASLWPCEYVPGTIIADNGIFKGKEVESLARELSISIENVLQARGNLKSYVEHLFYLTNVHIGTAVPGNVNDAASEATLTPSELEEVLLRFALEYNHHTLINLQMAPDMVTCSFALTPHNLFQWGLENRAGDLRKISSEKLMQVLLPTHDATFTERGLRVFHHYYTCKEAEQAGYFERIHHPDKKNNKHYLSVQIHYDPHREDTVYYINPQKKIFWTFHLTEDEAITFAGKSHYDSQFWYTYLRCIKKKAKKKAKMARIELTRDLEIIAEAAKKKTDAAVKAAGGMDKSHLRQNRVPDQDKTEAKRQSILYGSSRLAPDTPKPTPVHRYKNPFAT